ncbi:YoaK family protein [Aerococcus sp. UMB7834]|uniref:YoaK family protein n=1 Tax=Aerococcus sp. UMB7834 TaxID=3046342 RepID=UPI00254E1B1E|nr:YoaK family protein [Aerococcus sp. UMB7834]MDK6805030.1 YoaK family protein [Aerococcus sp. UMB7834]
MTSESRQANYWSVLFLRFLAGYINVTMIIHFATTLAGQTGSLTNIPILIVQQNNFALVETLSVVFAFLMGTIFSGFCYPHDDSAVRLRYTAILSGFGLLWLATPWLDLPAGLLLVLTAFSLGFQNGMRLSYRGITVRTTIMTGLLTDIGVMVGRWLNRHPIEIWRLTFHLNNLWSFLAGGIFAALVDQYTPIHEMLVAGILDLLVAGYFFFFRDKLEVTSWP